MQTNCCSKLSIKIASAINQPTHDIRPETGPRRYKARRVRLFTPCECGVTRKRHEKFTLENFSPSFSILILDAEAQTTTKRSASRRWRKKHEKSLSDRKEPKGGKKQAGFLHAGGVRMSSALPGLRSTFEMDKSRARNKLAQACASHFDCRRKK